MSLLHNHLIIFSNIYIIKQIIKASEFTTRWTSDATI